MTATGNEAVTLNQLKILNASEGSGSSGGGYTPIPEEQIYSSAPLDFGNWSIKASSSNSLFRVCGFYTENLLYISSIHTSVYWRPTEPLVVSKKNGDPVWCSEYSPVGDVCAVTSALQQGTNVVSLDVGSGTADLEIYPTSGTLNNIIVMLKAFFY